MGQSVFGGGYVYEGGRIAYVELAVLSVDLGFNMSVLLKDVFIVAAADKKYLANTVLHQLIWLLLSEIQMYDIIQFHVHRQRYIILK